MNISKVNLGSVNDLHTSEASKPINQLMDLAPRGMEGAWSAFIQGMKELFAEEERESPAEAEAVAR